MATQKGLEPSTSSVTGWHSNQLNYCASSLFQAAVSVYQMNQALVNRAKWPQIQRFSGSSATLMDQNHSNALSSK